MNASSGPATPSVRLGTRRHGALLAGVVPRRIAGVPGPEDVAIDHEPGVAYVSSQCRDPGIASQVNGALYRLHLRDDDPQPVCVSGALEERIGAFHPHGIDLFVGPQGERRLFVINHRSADTHAVEILDLQPDGSLAHVRRVADDRMLASPNDILALGRDRFVVVNDHGFRAWTLQRVEDLLSLSLGQGLGRVAQCTLRDDGERWAVLADGIGMGAGIAADNAVSPMRLYVSSAASQRILVYRREGANWAEAPAIALGAAPDNLMRDARGRLWVACHPDPLAFHFYMKGWRDTAPSRVLRIADPEQTEAKAEPVFEDEGDLISAASVAAWYADKKRARLLVGAVRGRHLLLFDLPPDI